MPEDIEIKIDRLLGGSPVPIFVIDNDHRVIYWNRAIEIYTGVNAGDMIGTRSHCFALYKCQRECLVDVLLSEDPLPLLEKWYEGSYRKCDLIEGAYEAEDFFPGIGKSGKWLHFTASLIRDEDGSVIGAIETLEDITGQKEAEEKLKESRDKYLSYIDNSPVGLFVVDKNWVCIEVNPAACEMTGYKRGEILNNSISVIIPEEDLEKRHEEFLELLDKKEMNREIRLRRKNGGLIPVILRAVSLPDGNYLGFTTDVTELRDTGNALLEKEKIFRLLFENMSEGVAIHDLVYEDGKPADYIITDVNDAYESIIGIKKEEAVGSSARELYGIEPPPYLDIYSSVALSGTPQNTEIYFAPMDKYFEISIISPRKGSFATIFSDITDRKRSEIILKESEERFREVFNNANDIIILIEIDEGRMDRIAAINTRGVKVFGYEKDEFPTMDPLMLIDESDREKLIGIAEKSDEIGEDSFEILIRTKDGKTIPVEAKSRIFYLGKKQLSLSILRDITERKTAMEIEKRAFSQIEDNIRQLATLGDSIRNPLAVIVGLADLNGGELGDKIKKEAAVIDDYITMLDRGWIESEKVRDFLKRHYNIK